MKLILEKEKWESKISSRTDIISEEDIAEIVSKWTGIPVKKLVEKESELGVMVVDVTPDPSTNSVVTCFPSYNTNWGVEDDGVVPS